MQRLVAASLLGRGTSIIREPATSADCIAALASAELLGADLGIDAAGNYHITGGKQAPSEALNVGESGLSLRLFTCIGAMSGFPVTISGEGSITRRPVQAFASAFEQLGAHFSCNNDYPPVNVQGPFLGGEAHLDGSVSSQFLSGLLMALPLAKRDSTLHVHDLQSKPYIDLTLEVMEAFGVDVMHHSYSRFMIPGNQFYRPADVQCDGDWSGAASLLVAGALASRNGIEISGLDNRFTQADRLITGALLFAGARVHHENGTYRLVAPKLRGISIDLSDAPDLFPVLAAMASAGDRPSVFTGIERLVHKESNRALTIQSEFAKAGIAVDLDEVANTMTVHPGMVKPCEIDAHNDHRIAMAAALLGLRGGPITILQADCVSKSYPHFFDDLEDLGAQLKWLKKSD
jgi:3-phosphoshikimate 1-carboxyvinyltransferase